MASTTLSHRNLKNSEFRLLDTFRLLAAFIGLAFIAFKSFCKLVWAACRSEAAAYAFELLNHVFDFHALNESCNALCVAVAAACEFYVAHQAVNHIKVNFCRTSSASLISHNLSFCFALVSRVTRGNDTSLSAHSFVIRNAFSFRCF